ncbi:MAG: tetratricopeptide repeat protein [Azospirillaceae bacterium]|nr:tetratricopeptide repeat protein [Azospirillaceae bacterium]
MTDDVSRGDAPDLLATIRRRIDRGDVAAARDLLDRVAPADAQTGTVLGLRGYALFHAGAVEPARAMLTRAVAAGTSDALPYQLLAVIRGRSGVQDRHTDRLFCAAIERDPAIAAFWLEFGHYLSACGRLRDSLAAFSRVLRLGAGVVEAVLGISLCHIKLHNLDRAVAATRAVLQAAPDHRGALFNLAVLDIARGRPQQAEQASDRLIALDENVVDYAVIKADALIAARQPDRAFRFLRQRFAWSPDRKLLPSLLATAADAAARDRVISDYLGAAAATAGALSDPAPLRQEVRQILSAVSLKMLTSHGIAAALPLRRQIGADDWLAQVLGYGRALIDQWRHQGAVAGGSGTILAVMVVWGPEHVTNALRYGLPSLLHRDNLPRLAMGRHLAMSIFTDAAGRGQFENSPSIAMLKNFCDVTYEIIPPSILEITKYPGFANTIFGFLHHFGVFSAYYKNADILFLAADLIFTPGSLAHLALLAGRADCDTVFGLPFALSPASLARTMVVRDLARGDFSLDPRRLIDAAFTDLHPRLGDRLVWPGDTTVPDDLTALIFPDTDHFRCRIFQGYPFYISHRRLSPARNFTWQAIDNGLIWALFPEPKDFHRIRVTAGSDDFLCMTVETKGGDGRRAVRKDVATDIIETAAVRDLVNPGRRWMFQQEMRLIGHARGIWRSKPDPTALIAQIDAALAC